jgi:glycosyltransferase involved in cell wall biosynthesis
LQKFLTSDRPSTAAPSRRILFVLNEAYFFLSHRLALARAVQAAGFEVHVAAPADHVWAPSGFSTDEIERQGFQFHPIPMSRRGGNPFVELRTLFALVALYRRFRPELVHHLTIKPNLYGGLAARIAKVPKVVFSVTGLGQVFVGTGPLARLRKTLISTVMKRSMGHPRARVIFQNPDDLSRFVAARIVDVDRARVILGSGVDVGSFAADPPPKDEFPLVMLCSRLIWEKGIREFVEAAQIVRQQGVPARFALVGDTRASNPRAVPRATLEEWEKNKVVEWWGFRADIAQVLAEARVVCLPSTYGEGVPKILLEAAAAGRAIITTDIAGCKESVVDGVSGLLVPPGDVGALVDALRKLVVDHDLAAQMGRAGRKLAEEKFDVRTTVSATMGVYGELDH